jgi:hypothetical protein
MQLVVYYESFVIDATKVVSFQFFQAISESPHGDPSLHMKASVGHLVVTHLPVNQQKIA